MGGGVVSLFCYSRRFCFGLGKLETKKRWLRYLEDPNKKRRKRTLQWQRSRCRSREGWLMMNGKLWKQREGRNYPYVQYGTSYTYVDVDVSIPILVHTYRTRPAGLVHHGTHKVEYYDHVEYSCTVVINDHVQIRGADFTNVYAAQTSKKNNERFVDSFVQAN